MQKVDTVAQKEVKKEDKKANKANTGKKVLKEAAKDKKSSHKKHAKREHKKHGKKPKSTLGSTTTGVAASTSVAVTTSVVVTSTKATTSTELKPSSSAATPSTDLKSSSSITSETSASATCTATSESSATNTREDLKLTLHHGMLRDSHGRCGYIAKNQQFQFDNVVPTTGYGDKLFSIMGNYLAWNKSTVFMSCPDGGFSNLYAPNVTLAERSPVKLQIFRSFLPLD